MTAASVTCLNGHQNPEHYQFCGECGTALPVTCPNGHRSPPNQLFCGECGSALERSAQKNQPPEASPSEDGIHSAQKEPSASQHELHREDDAHDATGGDDARVQLKRGDRVQVLNTGDDYDGVVGIVREVTNAAHGYTMRVALEGDLSTKTFRPNQLKLVGGAVQQPAAQQFPRESKSYAPPPQDDSFQQGIALGYWQNLSSGAKIGMAVAIGIVLLIVIASIAIIAAQPEHSQRYKDCEAAMINQGYKGDALKQAIQFCVDTQ